MEQRTSKVQGTVVSFRKVPPLPVSRSGMDRARLKDSESKSPKPRMFYLNSEVCWPIVSGGHRKEAKGMGDSSLRSERLMFKTRTQITRSCAGWCEDSTRLTWGKDVLTLAISAKGASSPRKGPCPPYLQIRRLRTFFQPDSGGLQAQLGKEGRNGCQRTTRSPQPRTI
jgi:hypothetical protein